MEEFGYLLALPAGDHLITASATGYQSQTFALTIHVDHSTICGRDNPLNFKTTITMLPQ